MKPNKDELLASLVSSLTKLNESVAMDFSNYGIADPRDYGLFDQPGFYPNAGSQSLGWLNRQRRGEYIPAYLNESQLSWMRRRIRMLAVNNEIAINAVNVHQAYAIGEGFKYEVSGRFDAPSKYENYVQAVVDAFVEHNELALKESEILSRMLIDGEAFIRLFPTSSGVLALRFVEPEFIRSPSGDTTQDSFGVRHKGNDLENVEGYWIDESGCGEGLTFVPAGEVVHFKWTETPSNAKRGFSAFYPIEGTLRAVEDLLQSTVAMAKARAKIAWIRKLQNITADVAQALVTSQANVTGTDPQTQEDVNMEKYRYGSILTTNADIEMPSANISASDHVGVMQMVLRIIAARFSMPEYMLSADASNSNYSSTLVAESPFVKAMQRLQYYLGRMLGGNRYSGPRQSLIWRQIYHAVEVGILPEDSIATVKLQVTGPSLTVRDASKDAQVDKVYSEMGVKSITTIQLEQGLDPDEERANIKREKAENPPPPPPPSPPP